MTQAAAPAQSDRIHRRLRRAIVTCELDAGTRLKVMDIAAEEHVSPGAVREALSRLMGEHLVTTLHQRGFRVSPLSRSDMFDLFTTRAALESDLVARAVALARPDWQQRLVAAYHALEAIGPQPIVSVQASGIHEDFHRALVAGCGSAWSLRLFETIYTASERYRFFAHRHLTGNRKVADEHAALFTAARQGDARTAGTLCLHHILCTRDALNDALAKLEPDDTTVSAGIAPHAIRG